MMPFFKFIIYVFMYAEKTFYIQAFGKIKELIYIIFALKPAKLAHGVATVY